MILICFAVDSPDSLDNVQEKWISEVLHFCSGLPIILVGCKQDLRNDPKTIDELRRVNQRPVQSQEVRLGPTGAADRAGCGGGAEDRRGPLPRVLGENVRHGVATPS